MRIIPGTIGSIMRGVAFLATTIWETTTVVVRSKTFWILTFVVLSFWPFAILLPRAYLFDIVNSFTVCVGIGLLIAFMAGAKTALRENLRTGGQFLVLGIVCTWAPTVTRHLYNWIWRYMGKPEFMIDHELVAFMVYVTAVGGFLHLFASHAIDNKVPETSWRQLGIVVTLSLMVASFFILYFEPSEEPPRSKSTNILEAVPIEEPSSVHVPPPDPPAPSPLPVTPP